MEKKFEERKEPEIVYSRSVKAGKRIYYLDVRKARNEDLYLCITESKRRQAGEDEVPSFEKHKLFLYKEDFEKFSEGLQEVIYYIKERCPVTEARPYSDRNNPESDENQGSGKFSDVDFDEL